MQKHQFSGKNLEEALNQAAHFFAVDKAFVCYNSLTKTSGGLFAKIFSRGIQIEAWVETAKEDLQEAARKAVREALKKPSSARATDTSNNPRNSNPQARNAAPVNSNRPASRVVSAGTPDTRPHIEFQNPAVKELLLKYNELFFACFSLGADNYNSTSDTEQNAINIQVEDDFLEEFLTKSDKLSLAYEHVFKRIAQKKIGDISGRLSLTAGSSNEKREERLINIAKSLAEKVLKTGKSMVLSSKSSQERRVIHMAIESYAGVGTRSVGMGEKRRLVIYALDKKPAGDKRPRNTSQKNRPVPKNGSKKSPRKKSLPFKEKTVNE